MQTLVFVEKNNLLVFLIRKYTVNGRSYIDILNPTVEEYTCQLLFSNTFVSCPRCLRTNSFILRTKTSLNTVSSNFVTETKHTLANFFLRHSYLISTFLLFYSLNLKTTEEEYTLFGISVVWVHPWHQASQGCQGCQGCSTALAALGLSGLSGLLGAGGVFDWRGSPPGIPGQSSQDCQGCQGC